MSNMYIQKKGPSDLLMSNVQLNFPQVVLVLSTISAPIDSFLEGGSSRLYRRWVNSKCDGTWPAVPTVQNSLSLSHQYGLRKVLPWHLPSDQQHLHQGGVWSQRGTGEFCKFPGEPWAFQRGNNVASHFLIGRKIEDICTLKEVISESEKKTS